MLLLSPVQQQRQQQLKKKNCNNNSNSKTAMTHLDYAQPADEDAVDAVDPCWPLIAFCYCRRCCCCCNFYWHYLLLKNNCRHYVCDYRPPFSIGRQFVQIACGDCSSCNNNTTNNNKSSNASNNKHQRQAATSTATNTTTTATNTQTRTLVEQSHESTHNKTSCLMADNKSSSLHGTATRSVAKARTAVAATTPQTVVATAGAATVEHYGSK